jgi:hypothetical protein
MTDSIYRLTMNDRIEAGVRCLGQLACEQLARQL